MLCMVFVYVFALCAAFVSTLFAPITAVNSYTCTAEARARTISKAHKHARASDFTC